MTEKFEKNGDGKRRRRENSWTLRNSGSCSCSFLEYQARINNSYGCGDFNERQNFCWLQSVNDRCFLLCSPYFGSSFEGPKFWCLFRVFVDFENGRGANCSLHNTWPSMSTGHKWTCCVYARFNLYFKAHSPISRLLRTLTQNHVCSKTGLDLR